VSSKRVREKRFLRLGWNWDRQTESPGADLEQAVNDELERCASGDGGDVCRKLFSKNFAKQVEGIKLLEAAVVESPTTAELIMDVPLMWCIIRLYRRETTAVTSALLSLVHAIFTAAAVTKAEKVKKYIAANKVDVADGRDGNTLETLKRLTDFETDLFFPYFVEKAGHKIERMRDSFRGINHLLRHSGLIKPEQMLSMLVRNGMRSKNTRTCLFCFVEILDIARDISPQAPTFFQNMSRNRFVSMISAAISGRDESQRRAALDVVEEVWRQKGCDTAWLY
jgi:hypothetical protein